MILRWQVSLAQAVRRKGTGWWGLEGEESESGEGIFVLFTHPKAGLHLLSRLDSSLLFDSNTVRES